jgi:hypothetical protein
MEAVLAALLASLALGAIGLPLAAVLLRRLPDMGAGLAVPLGLLTVSLPYFLLRVADVLPPGRGGYLIAAALAGAGAALVARNVRWRRADRMRLLLGIVVAASVYFGAFLAYTAFRSYNPEIAGTEQPMDLLFLNATLTSPEYPPRDPWLAGEPVSYYYFGYLQTGVLTAISGVPASVGYNLGLAATFAATASGLVSVAWALARWALPARARGYAALAPAAAIILVLFVGSLSAVFEWAAAHERYSEPLYRAFGVDYLLPCEQGATANCYAGPAGARTSAWYPTEYWFWWRGSPRHPRDHHRVPVVQLPPRRPPCARHGAPAGHPRERYRPCPLAGPGAAHLAARPGPALGAGCAGRHLRRARLSECLGCHHLLGPAGAGGRRAKRPADARRPRPGRRLRRSSPRPGQPRSSFMHPGGSRSAHRRAGSCRTSAKAPAWLMPSSSSASPAWRRRRC